MQCKGAFTVNGVSQGVTISTIVPSFHSQLLVFGLVCFVLFSFFFFFFFFAAGNLQRWNNGGGERERERIRRQTFLDLKISLECNK